MMIQTIAPAEAGNELSQEDAEKQARLLSLFADPTRLRILAILLRQPDLMCVSELCDALGKLRQPTISHHLQVLREGGVIEVRKVHLHAYYRVRVEALAPARRIIEGLEAMG